MNHSRQHCLYRKVICCFVVELLAFSSVICIYSFNLVTIEDYCNLTEYELYMNTYLNLSFLFLHEDTYYFCTAIHQLTVSDSVGIPTNAHT